VNNHKNTVVNNNSIRKQKVLFIGIIVIFSSFTDGKLQPT